MLVLRDSLNNSNISSSLEFVKFLHPRTNQLVYYAICKEKDNENIFELQSSISRKHGSWFINQQIIGNSKIVCLSIIDPKFLLLPYLLTSEKYCPIDQLISATYKEGCDRLPIEWINKWNMIDICDINDKLGDDMILYRLNKEKLEKFLRKKVYQLAYCISKRRTGSDLPLPSTSSANSNIGKVVNDNNNNNNCSSSGSSSNNNNNNNNIGGNLISKEDVKIAIQIITDYLPTKVSNEIFIDSFLKESLNETSNNGNGNSGKRTRDWEESLLIEKDKVAGVALINYDNTKSMSSSNNNSNKKSNTNSAKKTLSSTTTRKMVKNDGNKNIMNFFSMKKK